VVSYGHDQALLVGIELDLDLDRPGTIVDQVNECLAVGFECSDHDGLRVGFDLMSEGEVWIDNIKIYDLWFQESEKRELLKHIALAYTQRSELKVADCERFLTSYWAKFLTRHVPLNQPRVANLPAKAATPAAVEAEPAQPDALAPKAPPSMMDRVKDWIPKKMFPF